MGHAPRVMAALLTLVAIAGASTRPAQAQPSGGQPSVRWVGQDGHDFVGPNNRREASEIQDMHLAISGLHPHREVTFVDVTTEQAGDQWQYNAQSFAWKAELRRAKGARTADLFLEPGHVEAPRNYHVLIKFDDNTTREFDVRGHKVSRSLRMPGAAIQARWVGQDRQDRVGPGASVGPDGLQDARIHLSGVSTKVPVKAMRVEGTGGAKWESGANPDLLPNAEYWPDPKKPGEGDLFLQPDRELKGESLKVRVLYANDTLDSASLVAGKFTPRLRVPDPPLPRLSDLPATARWLGQDGQGHDATGPGSVHVNLSGLGRQPSPMAAVLTDSVRGTWVYRHDDRINVGVPEGDVTGLLAVRPGAGRGTIDVFFPPYRDETHATFTLRFLEQNGRMSVVRFAGGPCDPGRRQPLPADGRVDARPGDDLNALCQQGGTVTLGPGTYRLSRPLVLEQPVTLTSEAKPTLIFSQAPGDAPWTAAIKIHAGNTTLNGFAVRFEGPIRWDQEVSYGPAVIGTTDNKDPGQHAPKFHVVLTRLDLEIPPAADPTKWIEATRLIRLTNARSGEIAGNILRGGPVEFFDGPWLVLNNDFRGTPPGTSSHGVFTGHGTHDVVIKGNRARPVEPAGKTWRFLVLTHRGAGDRVEDNVIENLGFRDDDTIPSSNEPEIILTEAYHLTYEGKVAALSPDGRLLRIHRPQGQDAATGDPISILAGPGAGQYRRIAQVIDPQTYLVEPPLPIGAEVVSISRGFVDEHFLKNRIDMRGGRKSAGMVLVGNHFGTRVVRNHVLGGANALRFAACPTETPVIWGWSHAPFLGGVIEGNILEDAEGGTILGMEHSARDIKSNHGRTYMSIALNGNTVRWSDAFLKRFATTGAKGLPPGLILGYAPSHDPAEFVVKAADNHLDAPGGIKGTGSLTVNAAEYNSQKMLNRKFALPRTTGPVDSASSSTGQPRR